MSEIKLSACPNCGCGKRIQKEKGPHTGEFCANCSKWLRWVKKDWRDFIWPIGKNKGKTLFKLAKDNRRYLEWAAENINGNLREKAQEALKGSTGTGVFDKPEQMDLFQNAPVEPVSVESHNEDNVKLNPDDLPW